MMTWYTRFELGTPENSIYMHASTDTTTQKTTTNDIIYISPQSTSPPPPHPLNYNKPYEQKVCH